MRQDYKKDTRYFFR